MSETSIGEGGSRGDRPAGAPTMTADQYARHRARVRWTSLTLLAVVLALLCGGLVYISWKPTYEASAWLRIEDMRPYLAFPSHEDSRRFIATQVELLKSPLVLGPVVSKPEVTALAAAEDEAEDPLRWLETVKVQSRGQSDLYQIAFSTHNKEGSALVVNAIVESYLALQRSDESQQTERVIQLLSLESDSRADEVKRLRETIRALQEEATGKNPFAGSADSTVQISHPLGALPTQLANADVERAILEANVRALEKSLFRLGPQTAKTVEGSTIVELRGENNDFAVKHLASAPVKDLQVVLEHVQAAGNQALVRFERAPGVLSIDVDPQQTTASAVIAAISAEGTFTAERDFRKDDGNDGAGLVCQAHTEASEKAIDDQIESNPLVQDLRALIRRKSMELVEAELSSSQRYAESAVAPLSEEIRKAEARLGEIRKRLRESAKAKVEQAMRHEREAELARMRSQLEHKTLLIDVLKQRCKSESPGIRASSGDSMELDFLRTELARAEEVFERIESRIVQLRTEQRAPARVTKLQDAVPPVEPVDALPRRQIALASWGGFCLPFLVAGFWTFVKRRADAAEGTGRQP